MRIALIPNTMKLIPTLLILKISREREKYIDIDGDVAYIPADFKISIATGVPVATLLSRKHYAVKHLRKRFHALYDALIIQD